MLQKDNRLIKVLLSIYLKTASRGRYVLFLDFISLALAVYFGYALRLTFFIEMGYAGELLQTIFIFSACILIPLIWGGVYKVVWPRASVEEYTILLRWYVVGTAIFLVLFKLSHELRIPRSSLSILIILGLFFLTTTRAFWKLAFVTRSGRSCDQQRTLIIGAGEAGTMLARDLIRNDAELKPIGFVDDDPRLNNMSVASLKVLGTTEELRKTVIDENVAVVLIAIPSASGQKIKEFVRSMEGLNVKVRILPSLIDLADGVVSVKRLRSVKLEDLLRREPVKLDNPQIENLIRGKRILVTGAGGSIGSEICRQVAAKGPSELLVLGHGEQSIYDLLESFSQSGNKVPLVPIIADIADKATLESIFIKHRPQLVFHAAAHKHVPLMEDNPREALRVNSYGTRTLAEMAGKYEAERMVMISTDKAVHPSSIMGATKRIAERMLFYVQEKYPNTSYMAVRFGNVLGSRGSVIPKFEQQIDRGGPVTVTHKDMKRYFMLIPEAVSLVLQAGTMGSGGELFVLDMGEPVNIAEMAETLIRLHGHEPYKDIKIEFSGIRPGEKLYEELFYDPDHVGTTSSEKIYLSKFSPEKESLLPRVERLLADSAEGTLSESELKAAIFQLGGNGENEAAEPPIRL
ncbi:MAG: nucleoside-diphosphate sugar epimerase/dehydratase [Synergistota bacterium]|nr:nucleoside-diphosphate sugar epimerase/dehydratase [Synergistota bacterium]